MRIPTIPLRLLTYTQVGSAVFGVCTMTVWHCLNDCSDKNWERAMFVSAAISIAAQTVLAVIHQEPEADLVDAKNRRERECGFEEPFIPAEAWDGESKTWEMQSKQSRTPWKDYLGTLFGGIFALNGPVLCTLSSKREWCLVDPELPSMVSWVHVEEVAVALTTLSFIFKLWRTYRVRRLVIEQETKFIAACGSGAKTGGYGRLYHALREQYDFLGENHRLAFVRRVLEAVDRETQSGNYRR